MHFLTRHRLIEGLDKICNESDLTVRDVGRRPVRQWRQGHISLLELITLIEELLQNLHGE